MRFRASVPVVPLVLACASPVHAQVVANPYLATNFAGDVDTTRGGLGASVAYYYRGVIGFELDIQRHLHFFLDQDVAHLVPDEGVDINTNAWHAMANVVAPLRLEGAAGIWHPYGTAGLGVVRAVFDSTVFDPALEDNDYNFAQNDLAFNVGVGVMHALTHLVGVRVDWRYFHVLVDENATDAGYHKDYAFGRVTIGVTVGFPE